MVIHGPVLNVGEGWRIEILKSCVVFILNLNSSIFGGSYIYKICAIRVNDLLYYYNTPQLLKKISLKLTSSSGSREQNLCSPDFDLDLSVDLGLDFDFKQEVLFSAFFLIFIIYNILYYFISHLIYFLEWFDGKFEKF